MARITSAGENLNLFAGIMGGVKAIYARGGGGAKMGSLKLKAVMIQGLFQSDPHDARILKGFALSLAVATRSMDHLRNRPTLEINARINSNSELKTALYGGKVAPDPTSYVRCPLLPSYARR